MTGEPLRERLLHGPLTPPPPVVRRPARARPRRLTEAQWQEQVTDLAEHRGYLWMHIRAAQRRPRNASDGGRWYVPLEGPLGEGWPDLFLLRPRDGRSLFAELKRQGERPRPAQQRVLGQLRTVETATGGLVAVHVWTAPDLDPVIEALR